MDWVESNIKYEKTYLIHYRVTFPKGEHSNKNI